MPLLEAPTVELGSAPQTPSIIMSPSPSEISSASSPEPPNVRATPLFRALAMRPPEPDQPPGQDELERRLPGYRRIVIPRELTLIELLKQCSGVATDEEVLRIREAKLRVVAERVGLRRLHVLAPHLRSLTLDGSAISSLRDLGIGLVHLKMLSVNRCGLSSLDGVWGLAALRELHAAGNRLRHLHALAALQKLHTLNLANNPIEESNRLWTLGVCGALRRLTLTGTPVADTMNYRSSVASTLPMLVYLDDMPIHVEDVEVAEISDIDCDISSESESECKVPMETKDQPSSVQEEPEPQSGPSKAKEVVCRQDPYTKLECRSVRRRPNTSDCSGRRPPAPALPARPRTALERSIDAPSRLQILNTLMDEEWRCSGSELTSHEPVCGNLARALRRHQKSQSVSEETELEIVERKIEEAGRALAAEIPRAPNLAQWARFKEETGIEIDIDFTERPESIDPSIAIERLEGIERETLGRFNRSEDSQDPQASISNPYKIFTNTMNDYEVWKQMRDLNVSDPPNNVDDLFLGISLFDA